MVAHEFDWRDVLTIVKAMRRGTALYRSYYGADEAEWGLGEQLLASLADSANWLVWSKTEDGEKGRNRPRRIPRPGVEDDNADLTTIGGKAEDALPAEDMWDWLDGPFVELDPNTGQPLAEEPPAPLTREARDEAIRAAVAAGTPRKEVAAEHGVSLSTVGRAVRAA